MAVCTSPVGGAEASLPVGALVPPCSEELMTVSADDSAP